MCVSWHPLPPPPRTAGRHCGRLRGATAVHEAADPRQSVEEQRDDIDGVLHAWHAHAAWAPQCRQQVLEGLPRRCQAPAKGRGFCDASPAVMPEEPKIMLE
eukprot:356968-Chlamydomonas_euryale.AAC.29